jgi:hypothetical protein
VAELLQAFYGPSPADGEEPCGGCRR